MFTGCLTRSQALCVAAVPHFLHQRHMAQHDIHRRFRQFTSAEAAQVVRLAAELRQNTGSTPEADSVTDHHILAAAEVLLLEGQLAIPGGPVLRRPTMPGDASFPLYRDGVPGQSCGARRSRA
jgi:hypothetical protein